MTPHPNDLRRIYAVERQDMGAPLFWCGEDVWRGLDDEAKRPIRRFATHEDALEVYDRYFRSTGRKRPPAEVIDVGIKPGILCKCGKLRFPSKRQAERMLIHLWTNRWSTRRQERRVYECHVVPGGWHMTKQELRTE
jgi:hypothetical protein